MTWTPAHAFAASAQYNPTGATSTSAGVGGAVAVGDTILLCTTCNGDTNGFTPTVTDSLGNTYTKRSAAQGGQRYDSVNDQSIDAWYCIVTVAGTPTITYTPHGGTSQPWIGFKGHHFTGSTAGSFVRDSKGATQTNPGTGANAITTASIAAQANDLVWGVSFNADTFLTEAAGAGFSSSAIDSTTALLDEWLTASGAGAVTFTDATHGGGATYLTIGIAVTPDSGAGGGAISQRGCVTMIADRMVKAIMIASAVHTVVGRHELRGAAQRTKVALPVVVDVQIKPPKVASDILPYPWKGAAIKKPRPFPETALIRKPLPITKSVVLPHMLKAAPQRKPRLSPEVALTRTPLPIARTFVGDHVFVAPPAPARIIIDPTTTSVRIPLPIAHSSVLRATLQHPTTGSAAPIVSMIEMDAPTIRTFVAHRVRLTPALPATPHPDPTVALVRTPRIVVESIVGVPLPRLTVVVPTPSRARPTVACVRTPLPRNTSFDGPQGRWFLASHQRWTKPIAMLVRIPLPRVFSDAGSGIARGPAVTLTRAIPQYTRTLDLAGDSHDVTLSPSQGRTLTLNTSDSKR